MIFVYRSLLMIVSPFYFLTVLISKKNRTHLLHRPGKFEIDSKSQKTIWVHASSGEFEHAKFLIKELKEENPKQKVVVTYSSLSYLYDIQKNQDIDAYLPLPLDFKGPVSSVIKKINPSQVLFSRTDVWPELAHQLKQKRIPTLVFARAENNKNNIFKRLHYRMTFLKMSHISFVSERDKGRFVSTVGGAAAQKTKISVDGDPRVDGVCDRILQSTYTPVNSESDTTLILGSVWSEDLSAIAPSISKALEKGILTKVIATPHEPNVQNIEEVKEAFKGFPTALYSQDPNFNSLVTIVDQVGVLFDLYSEASVAFVGGSFKAKVHSVIEPLAHGLPVITGPLIANNSEAVTFSKKPYEFVRICKAGDVFLSNLKLSLQDDQLEIKESVFLQKGSSKKILQRLVSLGS